MNNFTIGAKLRISFFILAFICIFVGYVGYDGLTGLMKSLNKVVEVNLPSLIYTSFIKEGIMGEITGERGLINPMMMSEELRKPQYAWIEKNRNLAVTNFEEYKKILHSADEEKYYQGLIGEMDAWVKGTEKVISLSREKDDMFAKGSKPDDPRVVEHDQKVYAASLESRKNCLAVDASLNKIKEEIIRYTKADTKSSDEESKKDQKDIIYSIIFGVLFALIIGEVLSRGIKSIINSLMSECRTLINAVVDGDLTARADTAKINFEFRPIVEGINGLLAALIGPLNMAANYIAKIASGDMPAKITKESKGDFNKLKNNLNQCIDAINALIKDANILSDAAQAGNLSVRADASKHEGDYKKIVDGVNKTLDAVIGPLNIAADYVNKISKGDIPSRITDSYNGDFNLIKNNLNKCIDAINKLIIDSDLLVSAALEGKLSVRADVSKHDGDFRKIIDGVNKTLDAVIKPVEEAAACLEEMSNGNLDIYMKGDYEGDHAKIKAALNKTIDSINEILTQVTIAVEQVNTGSRQVSDASQSLSQSSTESASSIEQISSTMQQINSQTKQNAENAIQANTLSNDARNAAGEGNNKMRDMQKAMSQISEASNNVSKIIKAIDEIAFQTNLLALNAAVEAARAGKHGKGFTVVAEEVRNLAQRSAKAAKETSEMIEGSIKKTEAGSKIAEETAKSLEIIVGGSAKVTDLIGEIAAAAREQEKAVTQVNLGLGQIDRVTQQNTATAEEAAAASEELSSQAVELKGMLSKFNLKAGASTVNAYVVKRAAEKAVIDIPKKIAARPDVKYHSKPLISKKNKPDPEDIISLDDDDFGKF